MDLKTKNRRLDRNALACLLQDSKDAFAVLMPRLSTLAGEKMKAIEHQALLIDV